MSKNPSVSVITAFLNAEEFLREAVESIFLQSYTDWELLLIDDGSSDRSSEIARGYAANYPNKVRYFEHSRHQNRGISASLNLGIREAAGEYLAFLDSDDVWFPKKLEQQVNILESTPDTTMVYGRTHYWYSWTGTPEDAERDLLIDPGVETETVIKPPSLLVRFLREEVPIPCPSDIMVRRAAAIAVGGFEERFRRIFTDQVFYSKLFLRFPAFVTGESWFRYRKHSESAVAVIKKEAGLRPARLDYLGWLEDYLDDQGIESRQVRQALRRATWRTKYPRLLRWQRDLKYHSLIAKEAFRSIARRSVPALIRRWLRQQYSR